MWLLVIQVIAVIAASIRGWGAKPIIIYGLTLAISFVAGAVFGSDVIGYFQVVDYILIGVFIVMAIIGKEKVQENNSPSPSHSVTQPRIKCPQCAEWILPDAKICRYCGSKIQSNNVEPGNEIETNEIIAEDEYYYKLAMKYMQSKDYDQVKLYLRRTIEVSPPDSKWSTYAKSNLSELDLLQK